MVDSRVSNESAPVADLFFPFPSEREVVVVVKEEEEVGRSLRRGERLERVSLRVRERREAEEGAGEGGRWEVRRESVRRRVRWRVLW